MGLVFRFYEWDGILPLDRLGVSEEQDLVDLRGEYTAV